MGQQCVITFLVASAFPASPYDAANRGLLLFAGGALQLLLSSILLQFFGELRNRLLDLTQYLRDEQLALGAALFETADSVRQRRFLNSAMPYSLLLAATIMMQGHYAIRHHRPLPAVHLGTASDAAADVRPWSCEYVNQTAGVVPPPAGRSSRT